MSCCLLSSAVNAWQVSDNATVSCIIQWENEGPIYFKLSSGTTCFLPAKDKNMYSLILSLYATKNTACFHCHDVSEPNAGITGYKLHRVTAQ